MNSIWDNFFRRGPGRPSMHDLLRGIPLFADLNRKELDAVERILYRREYAPGEVVFRQGEPGVGMYIIEQGRVCIIREPSGHVLATLGAGDFFGEIALLNETPRSATARAETAATLWGFFQPELLDLLERNPRLGVKVLLPLARITGQRLVRADEELAALEDRRFMPEGGEVPAAAPEGGPHASVG
ncbi:cyclic nucleotide-binding domain-containing protein [Rhodocaloribacter litoris]|uniref:cyclic nucleotide-binding domain-containing protein n=1 Tax=Rhodocaloribacter litoris TaxID=2558931 RepID=UPI001E349553|nr:cyclic nucleotide-binding domain-containing protein [Rhodocaloribacter litoris]QXD14240.1 cyclic nucleotide-binding domain-containing protein [Rhodocaloribacter litoris]